MILNEQAKTVRKKRIELIFIFICHLELLLKNK